MARSDSSIAAFVGCGIQARSHLRTFAAMFPLREVRVYGRGQGNIEFLCDLAKDLGCLTHVCETRQEYIAEADLIVSSVTFSAGCIPYLDAARLKPGSFSAITDLAAPWEWETLKGFDRIVIDDLEQESLLPNKLALRELAIGYISGLVLGSIKGRDDEEECTAFIFRGHALGDLALAGLAYKKDCVGSTGSGITA